MKARTKKYVYGAIVLILWLATEVFIKNSGVILGGIPYGLMIIFWLWLFSRATGLNFGFGKSAVAVELEEEEGKAALMKGYGIAKNKDGDYVYEDQSYESYEEALRVARLNKYGAE
jgi:hypothetical protein